MDLLILNIGEYKIIEKSGNDICILSEILIDCRKSNFYLSRKI